MAGAEMLGRDPLHPPYAAFASTGAIRAIEMVEILRHAAGQHEVPITQATGWLIYPWGTCSAASSRIPSR
jgi:hypothetical protein